MAGVTISAIPLSVIGAMCTVGLRLLRGPVSWMQAVIVGVILGNVPLIVFATLEFLARVQRGSALGVARLFDATMLPPIALGSSVGLICALAFWRIGGHALRPSQRT